MPGGAGLPVWQTDAGVGVRGLAAQPTRRRPRAQDRKTGAPHAAVPAACRQNRAAPLFLERDETSLHRLFIPFVPAEAGTQFFGGVLGPGSPLPRGRTEIGF